VKLGAGAQGGERERSRGFSGCDDAQEARAGVAAHHGGAHEGQLCGQSCLTI
jgi:hypothetical protein